MEKTELKSIFSELMAAALELNMAKLSLKDQDLKIRTQCASALGYEDKEGKDDPKKIKSALMKKAIDLKLTGENKLEEDLDTMESYYKLMKSGDIKSSDIDKYGILADNVKNASTELAGIKKSAANELDSLEMAAMLIIIRDEIERQNSEAEDEPKYKLKNEKALYEKVEEMKNILK